ncbi:MAG: FAD-linked oxidase C-terminal domain-containing protein [Armatimonadota bacterium]|nr:FAD-linked oxidase C-terminal domain-containing protein [Armatimonadota bacterium]MDR7438071.1 FAD-linked oxidase C-terminal domain-containing protein [Armatimonadota bacterium]MDR7473048.1 FAD-linked oxidase C-terminal domain-containing protein [Armatimonadota bacterium]MDR7582128.1 FAD-linked oxidase C-terminal domain-containing protein [Armatimonadota bacterium]
MTEDADRLQRLARHLARAVRGEVRFDQVTRVLYSTDASIYQVLPLGVVIPRDADDVATTLRLCAEEGVPVLPRGAGTSLAGQAIGRAVVIDCSRWMDRILEIDPSARLARVQPGVVQDALNAAAAAYGLRLGPDTATSNRATLGGMIGNNSAGMRSVVYGKMVDHVVALRVLLWDGAELATGPLDDAALRARREERTRGGELYRVVLDEVDAHREEIARRYPRLLRRVAGYNLPELLERPFNLSRLLVGSEGTLGVVAEATVRLVPRPPCAAVAVVHFDDLLAALEAVPAILPLRPSAVELIDRQVLEMTRAQLEYARRMTFVRGDPAALLVVEFSGDHPDEVRDRLSALEAALAGVRGAYAVVRAEDPAAQDNIWQVRKAGQGLLQGIRGDSKPITFVEDTAVPPERLAPYIRRVMGILERHGVRAAIYAHASVGCLHVRPYVSLKDAREIATMRAIAEEVGELVLEFGGAFSGEHGDGLVRSWFLERYYGPVVYGVFRRIKRAFDPHGLLNPGKIVDAPPMTENLRYGPGYRTREVPTTFDWSRDGGFARAVEMCSGVGACRKLDAGTMCPSFMVTREEMHSTRGRANLLRAILSGLLPPAELTGRALYEALDLCLECKGCRAECPATVDMARLKAEVLAHHYRVHGIPLRARLFAHIHHLSRLGAKAAPASTWVVQAAPTRWLLDRLGGIDRRRPLPPFARPTFDAWWRRNARRTTAVADRPRVVLFADTFMRYHYPEVGRAAVGILERLGYRVEVPEVTCCGRPMISKGLLEAARARARENLRRLAPYAAEGVPIVGCEPSCLLTFRDEIPDLVPGEQAAPVARRAVLIDEFLHGHIQAHGWPGSAAESNGLAPGKILLHGHCHQKALVGTRPAREVLRAAGFQVEEVDSGCCGMAGSFGFEREHYELSLAIGERRLLPAVRALPPEVPVVAMGVSCRQQIAHGAGRRAVHLVELLADALGVQC